MVRIPPLLLACVALALPLTARAVNDCHDIRPVLDYRAVWSFQEGINAHLPLPSRYDWGFIPTNARANFTPKGEELQVTFDLQLPPGQVGLPYTVHRLELQIGTGEDRFVYVNDFTDGCINPGVSFFPGQTFYLTPLAVPARGDGSPRANEPVRIRLWGHL